MNAIFATVLDGVGDQVRDEGIHLAFLAFVGGVGIVSGILTWLLRRDLKRRDDDAVKMDLKVTAIDETVAANDRRHGYELTDIKIVVCLLCQKVGLEQPKWTSR